MQHALLFYRIARTCGYSVIQSLRFGLFRTPLPDRPEHLRLRMKEVKEQMHEHLSRFAELGDDAIRQRAPARLIDANASRDMQPPPVPDRNA
jgi:hypothetical protein